MNLKKSLSILLCFAVIFGLILSVPAQAERGTPGQKVDQSGTATVKSDARMFSVPGTNTSSTYNHQETEHILTVTKGTDVIFDYCEYDGDGDKWYHIISGASKTGYIYETFLENIKLGTIVNYNYTYEANFEKQLLYFPTDYRAYLRELHAKYPNFKFEPLYVGKTLESCVDMQYSSANCTSTKKYISLTNTNPSYFDQRAKQADGTYIQPEKGWTYASRVCIYNFMNPQNYLGEERIFSFLNLSKSSETLDGLRAVVKGTFLANGYDNNQDAYLSDITEAANQSGVSAYAIAALIIVEQGVNGTSPIISGNYAGYEGYYNFFNYGAYGETKDLIYTRGLTKAKAEGWSSRRAAIIGGAKMWGSNYIKKGQSSYYLMNFDLQNATHQYAANVQDSITKAKRLYSAFKDNTQVSLTFNIPVYSEFYQNPFPDVDMGQWYTDVIAYVKSKGIFSGFSDGMFRPGASIMRQDFVVALARISGENISDFENENVNLKDVKKGNYYYSSIAWACKKGIAKGYDSGYFGVGDYITREQVITILYRYFKDYLKKNFTPPVSHSFITDEYDDYKNVSAFAKDSVLWALIAGVISGKDGTRIAPKDLCTRAEIAAIFYNCIENDIITSK